MKKPIIPITFLIVFITISSLRSKNPWGLFHNPKLNPTSCRAVLVPLDKRIPSHWKTSCEENNLVVEIQEPKAEKNADVRPYLYRQLANHLVAIAKNSPNETLERVFIVRVKIIYPSLEINAVTEGKYISKLASITSQDLIAQHLQATVQIKEDVKTP